MMKRDGPPLKELQDALISAYPTRQDLAMMVSYGLGENLSALAGESNLEHMVYELLRWAEAHGRRDELIEAALSHSGQNPQLIHAAELLGLLHDQHSVTAPAFLCSAPRNLSLLNRLKEDLRVHGILGEKDPQASKQSSSVEGEDVREAISDASAVILIASASTRRSRWVKEALSIAQMYQRRVYVFWMQGDHLVEVMPTGWSHLPCIDARGERYETALQELVQALFKQTSFSASQASQALPPATTLPAPRNPYKGLRAFRVEDAADFFGRDRLIEELVEKMGALCAQEQQQQAPVRLLTVLGPSGSGKSSVVMAGLLPKLGQGALPGSQDWIILPPMLPGKYPLEALMLTLTELFPERSPKSIREDLEDDSARGLHLLLTAYVKQAGVSVLLIIDQFEELFTQTAKEDQRQQFIDILLAAVSEPHGPLMVVLTLRADFYDRLSQYPELGRLIDAWHVMVYVLEMRDLRAVIERPAQLPDAQLTFEDGLVGDLLFEVQGQVGALPLLQFTLNQLFECREDRMLTQQAYHEIGGVKGALAQHAEATYQSLSTEHHQRLARALFLRLINAGTVVEDATRRRVVLSELVVVDAEETAKLAEVTNAFTKARLLTTNTVAGVSTVEVSHEALIQAWMRLQDWLHGARDEMRLQQAISEDAALWNRYRQPADRLYRGSQLMMALRWRKANLLSLEEDGFLQASLKEREHEGRRTLLIGLVGVTGVVGMAGTGFFMTQLYEGASLPKSLHPIPGLLSTYRGHSNAVDSVVWSPDGKRIASGGDDNTVQVWEASSGKGLLIYRGHSNAVWSVAWSPDGKRIASGSRNRDGTVQVWDASSGSVLLTYRGHSDSITSVVWSLDGKRVASGSWDTTVQVWDANSGSVLMTYRGHTNWVISVGWEPSGKRIASGAFRKQLEA